MAAKKKKVTFSGYRGTATVKRVRISPQKARLVVDMIRNLPVDQALTVLRYNTKKGAAIVHKLLMSAVSNARENHRADVDKLWVTGGTVDSGPSIKRFIPRARGSASPIIKRSSHISVEIAER